MKAVVCVRPFSLQRLCVRWLQQETHIRGASLSYAIYARRAPDARHLDEAVVLIDELSLATLPPATLAKRVVLLAFSDAPASPQPQTAQTTQPTDVVTSAAQVRRLLAELAIEERGGGRLQLVHHCG